MKEERFLQPGKSPHCLGDQLGQRGRFGALEGSTATGLCRAEWRETCIDGWCRRAALPSLRRSSAGSGRGWVLRLRLWRSDPEERTGVDCVETA